MNATYSGVLSGGGSLTKQGSGIFTLAAANTFTGITTIAAGTLQLTNSSALGSSMLDYTTGTLDISSLTSLSLGGLKSTSPAATQNLSLTNGSGKAISLTLAPASGQTPNFYGSIRGSWKCDHRRRRVQTLSNSLTHRWDDHPHGSRTKLGNFDLLGWDDHQLGATSCSSAAA